ncbi:hypothetical protein [Aliiglaciecola aliphaticivorans]
MFVIEELRRIVSGSSATLPNNTMKVNVSCNGNAEEILARFRETMALILSVEITCQNDEESLVDGAYQLLEEWFEADLIPFCEGDDVSQNPKKVRHFGEERDWFLWGGKTVSEELMVLTILVAGMPISGFDDLRWLLHCCGAISVEQAES